jgi:lipopolysaccharide export system permease protein
VRILHRYLVAGFAWPFVLCAAVFFMMFVFVDSLSNLDEFIKKGAPAGIVAQYYLAMIPIIVNQILPVSSLMAVLYLLGHLQKRNEITAMKANGISGRWILAPILAIGLIASFVVLAVNERVTPGAAARSEAIKKGFFEFGYREPGRRALSNVTVLVSGGRQLFAREMRLDTRTLYDVIVLEHHENLTLKSKTTARRAVYEGGRWVFYDVVEYRFGRDGKSEGRPRLVPKEGTDLTETPDDFIRHDTDTEYMNTRQLRAYIDNTRVTGYKISPRLVVDLHRKIAAPFACFVIILVGAPTALRMRRGGALMSMGMGIFIVAAYYVAIAVSTALGKGGFLPAAAAAWLPHAVFLAVGVFLVRKYI